MFYVLSETERQEREKFQALSRAALLTKMTDTYYNATVNYPDGSSSSMSFSSQSEEAGVLKSLWDLFPAAESITLT